MALRLIGEIWHAYYRNEHGKLVTRSTGNTVKTEAAKIERILMRETRVKRARVRLGLAPALLESDKKNSHKHSRRLKLADALEAAAKYKPIGETAIKHWRRFVKNMPYRYMDEITPQIAYNYLDQQYGGDDHGKTFNNNRCSLNRIFQLLRLDSGIDNSPFDKVPMRQFSPIGFRPFSEQEFILIFKSSTLLWKTAELIAWHTGLRECDCHAIGESNIKDGGISWLPGKTARFKRKVWVPVKDQLRRWLDKLPPSLDGRFCGFEPDSRDSNEFETYFTRLLEQLGIKDNEDGQVGFPSIRKSFVTRLDEAHIARHAIRGMVGHVSDDQTDDYSFDRQSAKKILELPDPELGL